MTSINVTLEPSAIMPRRATVGSAGYDLFCSRDVVVPARGRTIVETGVSMAIPHGYYGRVAGRSGLAVKRKIDVAAGVIDSDYRGKIGVVLVNHSDEPQAFTHGDAVAQLIVEVVPDTTLCYAESLDETVRGAGGFGSTDARSESECAVTTCERATFWHVANPQ